MVVRLRNLAVIPIIILIFSSSIFAFSTRIALLPHNIHQGLDDKSSSSEHNSSLESSSSTHLDENVNSTEDENTHNASVTSRDVAHSTSTNGNSASRSGRNTISSSTIANEREVNELKLLLVGASEAKNITLQGYSIGTGSAELKINGGTLLLDIDIDGMRGLTTFSLILIINGTRERVGEFTTDSSGEAEFSLSYTLTPGSYKFGIEIVDNSNFKPGLTILRSSPEVILLTIHGEARTISTVQTTVKAERIGKENEANIKNAIEDKVIPVIISVSNSTISFSLIDKRFTVFAGKAEQGGIQISISANNVTGPRVILINLTNTQILDLGRGNLIVTLDGKVLNQAKSFINVINPSPNDEPSFVLISTSMGYQMLISIPSFSVHIIQILPALFGPPSYFILDYTVLSASLLLITGIYLSIYAKRKVYI